MQHSFLDINSAVISPCGRYRYRLERSGPGHGSTAIIMVNPSTADAWVDDATIRKLRGFGARHLWGRLIVGNLFALRATDVRELGRVDDPVGPENDEHLRRIAQDADHVVVAWGRRDKLPLRCRGRLRAVTELFSYHTLFCIGPTCKDGEPQHPLMLNYNSPINVWHPQK